MTSFVYRRIIHTVQHSFDRLLYIVSCADCLQADTFPHAGGGYHQRPAINNRANSCGSCLLGIGSDPTALSRGDRALLAMGCRDRQITGVLYCRHPARVHRYAAIRRARVGGGFAAVVVTDPRCEKVDPPCLTRFRGGTLIRLQANRYAGPAVRWLNRRYDRRFLPRPAKLLRMSSAR